MRTIPNIPQRGDYLSKCQVCEVPYLRSALVRCSDNLLRCPTDARGRNELELARESAMDAAMAAMGKDTTPADGAFPHLNVDGSVSTSDYQGPIRRTTMEDVYLDNPPLTSFVPIAGHE